MRRMGLMMTDHGRVVPDPHVLDLCRSMVGQLSDARVEEQSEEVLRGGKIDIGAAAFLNLCGFDDTENFLLTGAGDDFNIFGKPCRAPGQWFVVKSARHDLVLLFDDRSLCARNKTLVEQAHLGQIMGEMLQAICMNRD
jgi:hypothetical protein